jgi:hypothetical protein
MKNLHGPLLAAALLCLPFAAGAITADELVAKNLAARGGIDKLRSLQTQRETGKIRFGSLELDFSSLAKHPNRLRFTQTLQGFDSIYALDGKEGWKIEPSRGRKDPEWLSKDDLKNLIETADFQGWLVDYKAKGFKLDYLGTEDVDGTDAHKLKLTRPNGDYHYLFLDPDHFLEIRIETHDWIRGSEQVTESDLGEYEQVDGTWWPALFVSGEKGSPQRATVVVNKIELNVPADDTLFQFPDVKKN